MSGPRILFYDGNCGLCHGAVRFALRHDRKGCLTFAPLQGETFLREVTEPQRAALPDSLVLLMEDGELLTRSTSVIALM
ncbi:MAG: DUF393 domain-containing protein, partial [Acidobacteria bacterium]|nr:DUF393 domain-containing protein [Acidobacteriota bacterium]